MNPERCVETTNFCTWIVAAVKSKQLEEELKGREATRLLVKVFFFCNDLYLLSGFLLKFMLQGQTIKISP